MRSCDYRTLCPLEPFGVQFLPVTPGSVKAEMRGVGSARENALCIVHLPPANSPEVRGWPPWLRVHLKPKVSSLCGLISVWSTRKHLSSATMSLSRVILTRTTEFLIMTPGLCSNAYIY